MFEDVELYLKDLRDYYEEINNLNDEGISNDDKKRLDLDNKFKDKIRKYLPSALNIVNDKFNCKFSLYKEGQEVSATFKMISTKVKKTKQEVLTELMNYEKNSNLSNISPSDKRKLDLALEILIVYSDDNFKDNIGQSKFLEETKSLPIDNTPYIEVKEEEPNLIPTSTEIQYNPYAGQPIDLSNESNNEIDTNITELKPLENNPTADLDKDNRNTYNGAIDGASISIFNSK